MSENVKHKTESVRQLLEELKTLGVYLEPRTVVNLYGPPMVGKSVLALHIVRELFKDSRVVVLASEPSYEEARYLRLVEESCGFLPEVRHVKTFSQALTTLREVKDGALVVDSVSALADREASYWLSRTSEPRVVAARVVPLTRALALAVRQWSNERGSVAVLVTHATSTAGAFRYRGVADLKPSLAMRAGHYVDYELLLTIGDGGERVLTVVASRVAPWAEGGSLRLRFAKGGVLVVK
ncbi:MAG: hypothetical protein QXE66_06525 [Desulfurococcaceae archaeon]